VGKIFRMEEHIVPENVLSIISENLNIPIEEGVE
jgi:hypothetical protein